MVDSSLFNIPLSPPTSPRLAGFQSEQVDNSWQEQQNKNTENNPESSDGNNMALVHSEVPSLSLDTKPLVRSKTFPYTLRTSGSGVHQPDTPPLNSSGGSPSTGNPDDLSGGLDDIPSAELPSVTFGGSAPASPSSALSPDSPHKDDDLHSQQQDLNGLNITFDPSEEGEKKQPMSAAEIRAQKRKMKRFRLTHNQTRFLMSEFARQAHPDAAHRERLAREIPGLSPRQVQVWFQNRRAKLKRLTSDDRERMMRSRALPDDFDMTQALHSPFGAIHNVGSSLSSPNGYSPTLSDSNGIRPLNFDSLRRVPGGSHMSPSMGPGAFGGFNFTPPQSVADTLSPVSPAGDSPFSYSPSLDGQRRGNPFAGGVTSPSTFTSHPQVPRLQLHDSINRSRSESLTSPLRTTLSYPGQGDMNSAGNSPLGGDSTGQLPYGMNYSYPNTVPGYAATSHSRMRSFSNGVPRNMGPTSAGPAYSPTRTDGTPQTATFPSYTSSPMSTPNSFSMMSAPHNMNSFQSSYMRPGSPGEQFPSVGELVGDVGENGEHGENGNSEGLQAF